MQSAAQQYRRITEEMKKLVEESPNLKQIFLSRLTKAALTRFSTWLISVINSLDCKVDE